ncbi:hypothetical protein PXG99_09975 [Bacillus velezensis]|uniref:hypothetical protein n=2 Tax=Bacillus velezensis TaxID=492670 RepID=UPI001E45D1F1|nr:hypothetical protein [Bacillus velezensis]WED89386.1 hypothetical protein PXG99_09975 [Bacillus velezensis]
MMAKLDGVKTLDMVNGEITKVAYGGAAYERVEGEAKEFGSVGDLVLNGRIHCDLTVGAFYEIVINEEYGWTTVRDDIGDWHSDVLYNPRSVLFRKVAASANPSLEDRVSSAEGEIESLKSDVAALKGEPEYKRIDRSEARAGDFVKFDDPPSYLTDKEYYEIKEFAQGYPVIIDDDGDEYDTYSDEFEVYRKVSAASVEAERLKVGDYAKVVGQAIVTEKGEIVKVIQDTGAIIPFKVETMDGKYTEWRSEASLVRATDEEVAEAKDEAARAKFKKGAKVRLLSGGGKLPLIGFKNGKIYEVSDNNFDHPRRGKRIRIEGGDCFRGSGCATPDQLEILTEEEVAEIERKQAEEAKWAKIGRKVGEYKRGDIARVVDNKCAGRVANGDIIEVLKQASGGSVVDTVHGYFLKVELITPVEARFDR